MEKHTLAIMAGVESVRAREEQIKGGGINFILESYILLLIFIKHLCSILFNDKYKKSRVFYGENVLLLITRGRWTVKRGNYGKDRVCLNG